jgi:hypothetical protein
MNLNVDFELGRFTKKFDGGVGGSNSSEVRPSRTVARANTHFREIRISGFLTVFQDGQRKIDPKIHARRCTR